MRAGEIIKRNNESVYYISLYNSFYGNQLKCLKNYLETFAVAVSAEHERISPKPHTARFKAVTIVTNRFVASHSVFILQQEITDESSTLVIILV